MAKVVKKGRGWFLYNEIGLADSKLLHVYALSPIPHLHVTLCEAPIRETRRDHNTGNSVPYTLR